MHQMENEDAVATITRFFVELKAAQDDEDEDEYGELIGESVDVRFNGRVWVLFFDEQDGWDAFPSHVSPEYGWPSVATDGTDGEDFHVGGPDLTPEAIVAVLAAQPAPEPDLVD